MKKFNTTAIMPPKKQVNKNKVVNNSTMGKSVHLELVQERSELLECLTISYN